MGIWLHSLPRWMDEAGIAHREWPGWETRSRSTGGYDALHAIGVHHTASNTTPDNDCGYIWDNPYNSDRPIGAVLLDRTGLVTIGAAGATNTQGKGGPYTTSKGVTPKDSANRYWFSIEAANSGTGERWPDVQQDAYVRLCRKLCDELGLNPATDVPAHFEWSPGRKFDPAGQSRYASGGNLWNMDAFRADVGSVPNSGDEKMLWIMKKVGTSAYHTADGVQRTYTASPVTLIDAAVRAGRPLKDAASGKDVRRLSDVTAVDGATIDAFGFNVG